MNGQQHIDGEDMEDTQKFLSLNNDSGNGSGNGGTGGETKKEPKIAFNGLSKEQIMVYASDPQWVRARWCLFTLFWISWFGMLAAAVFIVFYTPACPYMPKQAYWDSETMYQLDVDKFRDSNNDMRGDLRGLIENLDYFDKIGVKSLVLGSNLLNKEQPNQIDPIFGDLSDMKELRAQMSGRDMHLVMDVPLDYQTKSQDTIGAYLRTYADGVRILMDADTKTAGNSQITGIVDQVNLIAKETFKPKMLVFYPTAKNATGDAIDFLNPSFMEINTEYMQSGVQFNKKLDKLYETAGRVDPMFLLNGGKLQGSSQSIPKRLADKLDASVLTLFHSLGLLIRGTPFVLWGDEIKLTDKDAYMKWNNELNCGFSKNATLSKSSDKEGKCENNVQRQLARGVTIPRIYKQLNQLRAEPSFDWGKMVYKTAANSTSLQLTETKPDKLISFVRKAAGFPGFLVLANAGGDDSPVVDFQAKYALETDVGVIKYFYSHFGEQTANEYKVNQTVDLNNIYLKKGELLVAEYSKNPVSGIDSRAELPSH